MIEEVEQGQAVMYFAEGCHATHNTKTGYRWSKKGTNFEIVCSSGRKRVNINGAVNAMKPEHLVYDIAESINAQSTKRICQQLLRKYPGQKIYLICDNARYIHNRIFKIGQTSNGLNLCSYRIFTEFKNH